MAVSGPGRTRRLANELKQLRAEKWPLFVAHPRGGARQWLRVPDAPEEPAVLVPAAPNEEGVVVDPPTRVEFNIEDFCGLVHGPDRTPYAGCAFLVHIQLSADFPVASPSVAFVTPILHPNIKAPGRDPLLSVCIDSLNSKWSTQYTLLSVLSVHLPTLLEHANSHDPLNPGHARRMKDNLEAAGAFTRRHALQHAFELTPAAAAERDAAAAAAAAVAAAAVGKVAAPPPSTTPTTTTTTDAPPATSEGDTATAGAGHSTTTPPPVIVTESDEGGVDLDAEDRRMIWSAMSPTSQVTTWRDMSAEARTHAARQGWGLLPPPPPPSLAQNTRPST